MKTSLMLLASCVSILMGLSSSNAQWVRTNGPFGGTVTAIAAFPDSQGGGVDIFAGTSGGGVYLSTDHGKQWQPVYTDLKQAGVWRVVRFLKGVGPSAVYAQTSSGLFWTTDRGQTWNPVGGLFENQNAGILAIYRDAVQDTVVLAGINASLFVSTDAGRMWVPSTTPPNSPLRGVVVRPATDPAGPTRLIAGSGGEGVYLSSDNGMTWTPSPLKGQISGIGASDSVIYAGVYAGALYRSTDEGASWLQCTTGLPATSDVREFAFLPKTGGGSTVVACNGNFELLLSSDNGVQWQRVRDTRWSSTIWSLTVAEWGPDSSAIFVGTGSGVYRSTNAGLTWDVVNEGLAACIVTALRSTSTSILAGTVGNGIFRTGDRGARWTPINNGLDTTVIESIQAIGGLTVNDILSSGSTLLAGTLGGIYRSTDEGDNWAEVNNDWTRQQIWSLGRSDNTLFAGGSLFLVFRSTDDGGTWNCGDTNFTAGSVMSLVSANGKLFAAAMGGGAYRSTDDGTSWTQVRAMRRNTTAYALAYVSPFLLLGTWPDGLLRSSDDGETWEPGGAGLPAESDIYEMVVSGSNVFAGTSGGVFLSTDYGMQWSSVGSQEFSTAIRSLAIFGPDLVAGTDGEGVIWKRALSEMITPAGVSPGATPIRFALGQNYPNPCNPSTVIPYELPATSPVVLKVFDVLGRVVATLVDARQIAGSHAATFDASHLPSGVYFYRLDAGAYHEAKKLLVLK